MTVQEMNDLIKHGIKESVGSHRAWTVQHDDIMAKIETMILDQHKSYREVAEWFEQMYAYKPLAAALYKIADVVEGVEVEPDAVQLDLFESEGQ